MATYVVWVVAILAALEMHEGLKVLEELEGLGLLLE